MAGLLPRGFYARDTAAVARDLLGKILVRRIGGSTISGTIVETEAYKHAGDPASHAYGGMTERNRAMFGEVGRSYVYFTYGMHYCFNAVARGRGIMAGAVLVRSVRPCRGADAMARNRGRSGAGAAAGGGGLADGPAKLTQAMRIGPGLYGADLTTRGGLFITGGGGGGGVRIRAAPRIGISRATDKRWNFSVVS